MILDFVPHLSGGLGACDDPKVVRRAVIRFQNVCDILLSLGKRQPRPVDALDADGFAILRFILTHTPDIASEVASCLPIPFQRPPALASSVVGKNKALKLGAVKILKMNWLYIGGGLRHVFPQPRLTVSISS